MNEQFPIKAPESHNEVEIKSENKEKQQSNKLKDWLRKAGTYTAIVAGSYLGTTQESSAQTQMAPTPTETMSYVYPHFDLDSAGVREVSSFKDFKQKLLKSEYLSNYIEQRRLKKMTSIKESFEKTEKINFTCERILREYENNYEKFKQNFLDSELDDKFVQDILKYCLPIHSNRDKASLSLKDPQELYSRIMDRTKQLLQGNKEILVSLEKGLKSIEEPLSENFKRGTIEEMWRLLHPEGK